MSELATVAEHVLQANSYTDVFGVYAADDPQLEQHIKKAYRRLARVIYPDFYKETDEVELATLAFKKLAELHEAALQARVAGKYGQPLQLAVIRTRHAKHVVTKPLAPGDLSQTYLGRTTTTIEQDSFVKVARQPADRDLLQAEATVLRKLHGPGTDPRWAVFTPTLLDSFTYVERGKPARVANVFPLLDGFYDLTQLKSAFPTGFDGLHMVWIWRRLLVALGHAHDNNVVHGAVLPEHVMIQPEQHGLALVDWCYSSIRKDGATYAPVKAIVGKYRNWYPAEVLDKQPPAEATDIAMAARCMIDLMGGDVVGGMMPNRVPKAFRAFFKGCLQPQLSMRPNDAWILLREFDELLEQLGSPYFPRRFRPFTMPTGTVTSPYGKR